MAHFADNIQGYSGLLMGLTGGAFAASLIRLTQGAGMPSIAVAAGRLGIAALVLAPFAVRLGREQVRWLSWRGWLMVAAAGLLMAGHFATFITALEYTSVLATVVFAATTPFFAAFIGWLTFGERPRRTVWVGIGIALAGTLLVAFGGDPGTPPTREAPLLGNGLALGAAFLLSVYFVIGRQVRGQLNTVTYSALVFGSASGWLLLALSLLGQSLGGHSSEAYLWLVAVAIVGQLIGHSGWNLALGSFPAAIVSLGLLMVPVVSTLAAIPILGEIPNEWALGGSAAVIAGVGVAVLGRR